MAESLKDLDNLKPIDHAVVAKPHTPVYKMHTYFARRPWSVFRSLIEHYSNSGSIILDPFCGGWLQRPNTILVDSQQLESGEGMSNDFDRMGARDRTIQDRVSQEISRIRMCDVGCQRTPL